MARIEDLKELVEKVMGWEVESYSHQGLRFRDPKWGTRYTWTHRGNINFDCWQPYTDANAALEVLGAMQRKGWTWNISPCGAECEVVMSKDGYDPIGCGEGSFCEAICAAALAAVRSEQ